MRVQRVAIASHGLLLSLVLVAAAADPQPGAKSGVTVIEDAQGDFTNPNVQLADYDIRRVTIERKGMKTLELTYEVAGDIEKKTAGYAMFIAKLDLDKNRKTGQDAEGIGSDINIRIYQDANSGGWKGIVDKVSPVSAAEEFTIDKLSVRLHRVSVTISSKAFKHLDSVGFVLVVEAQGATIDRVPDKDAMEINLQ